MKKRCMDKESLNPRIQLEADENQMRLDERNETLEANDFARV